MTSTQRRAILAAFVAALLGDLAAYHVFGELRAFVTHQHWIFYLYVGAFAAAGAGGLVHAALSLDERLRRARLRD